MTAQTPDASNGRDARDGRSEPQLIRTYLEIKPTGEDSWKATEPAGNSDLWGRGATPAEAVQHYAELVGESA